MDSIEAAEEFAAADTAAEARQEIIGAKQKDRTAALVVALGVIVFILAVLLCSHYGIKLVG